MIGTRQQCTCTCTALHTPLPSPLSSPLTLPLPLSHSLSHFPRGSTVYLSVCRIGSLGIYPLMNNALYVQRYVHRLDQIVDQEDFFLYFPEKKESNRQDIRIKSLSYGRLNLLQKWTGFDVHSFIIAFISNKSFPTSRGPRQALKEACDLPGLKAGRHHTIPSVSSYPIGGSLQYIVLTCD